MENTLFQFGSIIFLLIALYLLDFWNPDPGSYSSDSETHARSRYSVAEKILKQFKGQ